MGQALHIEHMSEPNLPPELRRKPPAFSAGSLSSEAVDELRRRSLLVRSFAEERSVLARELARHAERIERTLSIETFAAAESAAFQLARMELAAAEDFGDILAQHVALRRAVIASAPPQERAAWLGYLDPFIASLQTVIAAPRDARRRVFKALLAFAPERYESGVIDAEADTLLKERAAQAYKGAVEHVLRLPCEALIEDLGEEAVPLIVVSVPLDVTSPHRFYREALDRVHALVRERAPEAAGRVAFEFRRDSDAA